MLMVPCDGDAVRSGKARRSLERDGLYEHVEPGDPLVIGACVELVSCMHVLVFAILERF
jgi:hypothetical protein